MRLSSALSWRTLVWGIAVLALIVTPLSVTPADGAHVQRDQENKASVATAAPAEVGTEDVAPRTEPRYPREVDVWPLETGPFYGGLPSTLHRAPDVLHVGVGSFRISEGLVIPAELTADLSALATGRQYFLVQLTPEASEGEPGTWEKSVAELVASGAEVMGQVPVHGLIVRLNAASYEAVSASSLVQFIEPFHPAYRIAPTFGQAPTYSKEKASSTVVDLRITLFLGEASAPVEKLIQSLGGTVERVVADATGTNVFASLDASQLIQLARDESVRAIEETPVVVFHGDLNARIHQNDTTANLDFPYWDAGVFGGGASVCGDGAFCLSDADCTVGTCTESVAAQVIQITDTGFSVDGGDWADTRADSGWITSGSDPQELPGHRKVVAYDGQDGDKLSCDQPGSPVGHGVVVSGIAAGGATRFVSVDTGYGKPWFDDDPNSGLPGVFDPSFDTGYDGAAPGARAFFKDLGVGCPDEIFPSFGQPSIWLNDGYPYGPKVSNASLGAGPDNSYSTDTSSLDTFLVDHWDSVAFFSAGNSGDPPPVGVGPASVTHYPNCKNCISVGSVARFTGTRLWGARQYSSEGPTGPGTNDRKGVTIMAKDVDYACKSDDDDQLSPVKCANTGGAFSGTSSASPLAAGNGVLMRDYLAQGFYPDGSRLGGQNDAEKVTDISGPLVKAMVIASAEPLRYEGGDGINIKEYRPYRWNYFWGYGVISLQNVLPLTTFAESPQGLILADGVAKDAVPGGTFAYDSELSGSASGSLGSTDEFEVSGTGRLAVALTWNDPASAAVGNDLDLTLRYCGADDDCTSTDGTEIEWYGNWFYGDPNEDGAIEVDENGDGSGDWWGICRGDDEGKLCLGHDDCPGIAGFCESTFDSLPTDFTGNGTPEISTHDTIGPDEAIFITVYEEDPDGTTSSYVWAPIGKYEVEVACNGCSGTQPYAVAIAGGVSVSSSVRFDKAAPTCNDDLTVTVTEIDPLVNASTISSRTTITVKDATGAVVETESNVNFSNPGGALKFVSDLFPLSASVTPANDDGILASGDGYTYLVEYADPVGSRVSSAVAVCEPDVVLIRILQLGDDYAYFLGGGCDRDAYLDEGEVFTIAVAYGNAGAVDLIDTEVSLKAVDPATCTEPDVSLDPCRDTCSASPHLTINNADQVVGDLPANFVNRAYFSMEVGTGITPRTELDLVFAVSSGKSGFTDPKCSVLSFLLETDDLVHRFSTDYPSGSNGADVFYDLDNNEVYTANYYDPFYPIGFVLRGQSEIVQYDSLHVGDTGDPNPTFDGVWNFDQNDGGFTVGVWNAGEGSDCGTNVCTNWGEDYNFNGILDGPEIDENSNGVIDNNWSTDGGCGWMTKDSGASYGGVWHTGTISSAGIAVNEGDNAGCLEDVNVGSPSGICDNASTNAGAGCTSNKQCNGGKCTSNPNAGLFRCEAYDIIGGTDGDKIWVNFLATPKVNYVKGDNANCSGDVEIWDRCDPAGYKWRTNILDFSWNWNIDLPDDDVAFAWELDINTEDDTVTVIDDDFIQKIDFGAFGIVTGEGQYSLYDGFAAFAPNDETCTTSPCGQTNGSLGGDRTGDRGCYLNFIDAANVTIPIASPMPDDDDCDNDFDLGANGCPGACGIDDDGNGLIDDDNEICPCDTAVGGTPVPYDDDTCGDGQVDEGVDLEFGLAFPGNDLRQIRNNDQTVNNGLGGLGRGGGHPLFTTYEDLYGPPGNGFQAQVSFVNYEGTTSASPAPGYGMAIDDMVIEWTEKIPVAQSGNACDYTAGTGEGQCADLTLSQLNLFAASSFIDVSVVDFNAHLNQANCSDPGCSGCSITVTASSEFERAGETITLCSESNGDPNYTGTVPVSSTVSKLGDGIVYLAQNGNDIPSLRVYYVDEDDGVRGWGVGPDGQPGIAGVDDNFNCSGPNCTPGGTCNAGTDTNCDEAEEFCPEGIPSRYSDDSCGCRDNPIVATTTALFNTADLIVAAYDIEDRDLANGGVAENDYDYFADDGETIKLGLTIRNLADFDLRDVTVVISSDSEHIACITQPSYSQTGSSATPAILASGTLDTGLVFEFVVGNPTRTSVDQDISAEFVMSITGIALIDGEEFAIAGATTVQTFSLDLDLDWSGGDVNHTATWFDVFDYPSATEMFNVWEDGFDSSEDGNRCQYNDPNNPFSNNFPDDLCPLGGADGIGRSDWGFDGNRTRTSLPDGAPTPNTGSMHMGTSVFGNDTIYMSEQRYITGPMSNGAQPGTHGVQVGMGRPQDDPPELRFWHQLSIEDARLIGGLTIFESTAAGVAMVGVDNNDDGFADGDWKKVRPYLGAYLQQRIPNAINCSWDPIWDGTTESDIFPNIGQGRQLGPSSTCFPEFVWACVGLTQDPPCIWDGDTQLCADMSTCYPETGLVTEGYDDPVTGNDGVWIETAFALDKYRGQNILVRFLDTAMFFEGDTWFNAFPIAGNRDDGWWIDDVEFTGLSSTAITLSEDTRNETGSCSGLDCSATASWIIDPDRDGTTGSPFVSDAPGRTTLIDASASTMTNCAGGAAEWRFSDDGGVIRDWLSNPYLFVNPQVTTNYTVEIRCSNTTDFPNCSDSSADTISIGGGPVVPGEVLGVVWSSDTEIGWNTQAQAEFYDTLRSTDPSDFVGAAICKETAGTDTFTIDTDDPATGSAFHYLVRAGNTAGGGTLGTDSNGVERSGRSCP